jgi:hypothetical protein
MDMPRLTSPVIASGIIPFGGGVSSTITSTSSAPPYRCGGTVRESYTTIMYLENGALFLVADAPRSLNSALPGNWMQTAAAVAAGGGAGE